MASEFSIRIRTQTTVLLLGWTGPLPLAMRVFFQMWFFRASYIVLAQTSVYSIPSNVPQISPCLLTWDLLREGFSARGLLALYFAAGVLDLGCSGPGTWDSAFRVQDVQGWGLQGLRLWSSRLGSEKEGAWGSFSNSLFDCSGLCSWMRSTSRNAGETQAETRCF